MDRLEAMAMFVRVVDEGSLAAAARSLGRSPATVTRAVFELEARLGERMLHRSTRRLRLTEVGGEQLAVYRSVLAELDEASHGGSRPLGGMLHITAPELFGQLRVMPVVESYLAAHAGVRARVLLLNRLVNLVEEGIDLAVRLAPLVDSRLLAVRLGEVRRLVCAAPSYLERRGAPADPAALAEHSCIGEMDGAEAELWRFGGRGAAGSRAASSRVLSVTVRPALALNNAGAAVNAAVRGGGLCRPLSYQVVEHIAAGRLVTVLDPYEPPVVPVHLLFHPIPRRNTVLRAFVDHAVPLLRDDLTRLAASFA